MLESFLMNREITFYMKKETELEKKLHNKETIYNVLKDKEQKGSLTNDKKKKLKISIGILRILKNI